MYSKKTIILTLNYILIQYMTQFLPFQISSSGGNQSQFDLQWEKEPAYLIGHKGTVVTKKIKHATKAT